MGVKVVKDLVYSYIEIDESVQKLIDTASFQRLKRIKQLSSSYIFPSTNHTRYEHSIGVMHLACSFFEVLEKDGKTCGNIVSVNDQTAQHYFILDLAQKEVIIPIVKEWILEVNRDEKFIKMELPEGLIDVFLN